MAMGPELHLRRSALSAVCLFCLVIAAGCGQEHGRHDNAEVVANHTEQNPVVHWGYEGEEGPEHWADISPDFALCSEGVNQSPIDLVNARPGAGEILNRQLGSTVLNIEQRARVMDLVDNGHTIQVTNDVPMTLDLDDVHYELVQYHFHAPSEHTVNGVHSPLEAHFVHESADGRLAVIGVLIEEGAHDSIWDPVLAALPTGPGDERHIEDLDLELSELRPLPARYYRYEGSLTTPPCSEGVQWIVMAEGRTLSPEQLRSLVPLLHNNNRPVQSLGSRDLQYISSTETE